MGKTRFEDLAAMLLCCSLIAPLLCACGRSEAPRTFSGEQHPVVFVTFDPGHFHAALVQKTMYDQVAPQAFVFAPEGPDVEDHLARVKGFNTRADNPTNWTETVYRGADCLQKMIAERPGNVVVLSGNNGRKARAIKACIEAGLNVFADKPMCVDGEGFELLKQAFDEAAERGVLLYDIMTERSEITTILQRELAHNEAVFGRFERGSPENPAVVKESVHHFYKHVAGKPIKRPAWFFDTTQQGEGIVDVTTHLIDLVLWGCFPEEVIDCEEDVVLAGARRWPTLLTGEQFQRVTRLDGFSDDLARRLDEQGALPCFCNGEISLAVRGIHARVSVAWNYQAPAGGGDTHYSIMRGTKAHLVIRQGREQGYRPELYVEPAPGADAGTDAGALGKALEGAIADLQRSYAGIALVAEGPRWRIEIPKEHRIGHEAHFRQVTERYLRYLTEGRLPEWEVPNMLTKYFITTTALEMARR